jgi:hypothetical protein
MQRNYRGFKQVRLPRPSYKRAWERKNKDERRSHRNLAAGDGTAATSVQGKIRSHSNVTEKEGSGGVVDEDVGWSRASARAQSRLATELLLCPSVRR